jgi:hypothetical protein
MVHVRRLCMVHACMVHARRRGTFPADRPICAVLPVRRAFAGAGGGDVRLRRNDALSRRFSSTAGPRALSGACAPVVGVEAICLGYLSCRAAS